MRRQKWILVLLAAMLAPGAAFAAAPDFSAQMTAISAADFGATYGGQVFAFFNPTEADLNENGVLDATELALLEEVLDGSLASTAAVNAAFNQNFAAVDGDLSTIAASLGQPTSGPYANQFDVAKILAGYLTMGGERNWNLFNTIMTEINRATGLQTYVPVRSEYDETQSTVVGACGDADGDDVKNLFEALAAANEGAYVTAALDDGTTTAGEDTLGGCVFIFDAEPGPIESRHWYYNPANGNVYFVGSNYQGNLYFDQVANFASTLSVNGLLIENAHGAIINDANENAFIAGLRSVDDDPEDEGVQLPSGLTGANDAQNEGTWRWSDGTIFYIGNQTGAAQGGAYVNWGPGSAATGEPNNSSNEDAHQIRFGSGAWNDDNDSGPVIIEIEGDFTDTNSDGIPNQWTDANEDGLPDGLSVAVVNITGPTSVTEGQSITLVAASEPGDIYTWTSSDEGIATVEETGPSVEVTGVSPGTVEISVEVLSTAKGLGSTGSVEIEVLEAAWFDLCAIDDAFQGQGEFLASQVGDEDPGPGEVPLDFNEWDADGDDLPDAWALKLLAYALCEGGVGLAKSGSPAGAVAAFNSNAAAVTLLATQLNAGVVPFFEGLIDQQDELAALSATLAGNACNGAAGNPAAALATAAGGIAAFQEDLEAVIEAAPVTLAIPELLAGMYTISSGLGLLLDALLPIPDVQGAVAAFAALQGGSGLPTLAAAFGTGGPLSGCPDAAAISASAAAISAAIGPVPTLATPDLNVYEDDAKLAGEPLSGEGDYDGDGVTNGEAAQIVIANGGDGNDFIIASTGDFGPFWAGNPALPVGGMVGLGVLFSAMGAAGAVVLRRKK